MTEFNSYDADQDLEALFAECDRFDCYLSDEEIAERDAALQSEQYEFWMTATDATLDAL